MVANKNSDVSNGQRHPLSKWGNGDVDLVSNINWLGREGSNLRMAESKSAALPLGYAPTDGNWRLGLDGASRRPL